MNYKNFCYIYNESEINFLRIYKETTKIMLGNSISCKNLCHNNRYTCCKVKMVCYRKNKINRSASCHTKHVGAQLCLQMIDSNICFKLNKQKNVSLFFFMSLSHF